MAFAAAQGLVFWPGPKTESDAALKMSGVFVELGDRPTVYFSGCDPIQVESVAWHAAKNCKLTNNKYHAVICAVTTNNNCLAVGRFYRACCCSRCHASTRCEHCSGDDPIFDLEPSCPHYLVGRLGLDPDPDEVAPSLNFAGDTWTPDEDQLALLSWPLEVYTLVLAPVHKIQLCPSYLPANSFDFDARRQELWAERKANRSLFMYMLVLAARALGHDLPRDLVRHISDLAWPLPQRNA